MTLFAISFVSVGCGPDGDGPVATDANLHTATGADPQTAHHGPASDAWYGSVQKAIQNSEYVFRAGRDGVHATNRAQDLLASWRPDGSLSLGSRSGTQGALSRTGKVDLQLRTVG